MSQPMLLRRSFLARVVGAGSALAVVSLGAPVRAQATDADPTDPLGAGRGGATDADSGPGADAAGGGRGAPASRPTSRTDADAGANADRPNYGRGPARASSAGATDNDPTDRVGRGRGDAVVAPDSLVPISRRTSRGPSGRRRGA